jgi:hypothetical protein
MNKIELAVIVNGQPTVVSANLNSPLHAVVGKALEQTGNLGQGPENWELRDAAGVELDQSQKIDSFGFPPDVKLFLNLRAGIGGC